MKNDGILYNQKFNISHYVDEKLKDPNLKLKFGNNEFTMAEINNIIHQKKKRLIYLLNGIICVNILQ